MKPVWDPDRTLIEHLGFWFRGFWGIVRGELRHWLVPAMLHCPMPPVSAWLQEARALLGIRILVSQTVGLRFTGLGFGDSSSCKHGSCQD